MLRKKTAIYALVSLYEIAEQQSGAAHPMGVRAGDISQKYKLPRAYAAKILSQLANAGVLHSDRGPHGGFRLNKPVDEISLYDVFDSVGAIVGNRTKPVPIKSLPPSVQNVLSHAHQEAADALREVYMKTSVADLLSRTAVAT